MIVKVQYLAKDQITERLYELEEKLLSDLQKVAMELCKVKVESGLVEYDLDRDAIPETLAMLCEAFGRDLELHKVPLTD